MTGSTQSSPRRTRWLAACAIIVSLGTGVVTGTGAASADGQAPPSTDPTSPPTSSPGGPVGKLVGSIQQTTSTFANTAQQETTRRMSTLSNILKKISDTAQSITQNLK